jgi:hypothetical protein
MIKAFFHPPAMRTRALRVLSANQEYCLAEATCHKSGNRDAETLRVWSQEGNWELIEIYEGRIK